MSNNEHEPAPQPGAGTSEMFPTVIGKAVNLADIAAYFTTTILDPATRSVEHKQMFALVQLSEATLLAELNKLKKAQLERYCGFGRDTKKATMVLVAWRSILRSFVLADTYEYHHGQKEEDVFQAMVAKLTDADLERYRTEHAAAIAARAEAKAKRDQATENPQTLADFETCIRNRGTRYLIDNQVPVPKGRGKSYEVEQIIFRAGIKQLSEDELARYDELMAAKEQQRRAEKLVDRATVKRIEIGDGNYMEVMKWWHDKRECDTWLVVLAEREDRTTFEELCIAARKLCGNYSRAWQERPGGFQFFDEAQALKFVQLQSKDVFEMSRLERLVANRERVRGNAIEHFTGLADRMEDRAGEALTRERREDTERRIMLAENARDHAHADLAMAGTLRNYAVALQQRLARHTDRIRWRTHAEALDEILAGAGRSIPAVEYPWPQVGAHALTEIARDIGTRDGSILISRRILKLVQEAPTTHLVTFRGNHAADLLRDFYRRARLHRTRRWTLDSVRHALGNFKRLRLMNIDTLPELRAALREHLGHRVEVQELTRAEKVMLDLYPGQFPPDYFPTPRDVVELMLEYADVEDGMRCADFSAGSGHIVNVVRERFPNTEWELVEISGMLHRALVAQGYVNATHDDFFNLEVPRPCDLQTDGFDRILLNPPFGCDGVGTDIDHVLRAYEFLKVGGRMTTLMSDGVFYRGDNKAQEFRSWLEYAGGMDFELPEGAFLNSDRPTSWATRLVVIDRLTEEQRLAIAAQAIEEAV